MAAKSVKTVKVNLNTMLKKAIHQPRTNSGYTLYTHTKSYKDDGTGSDFIEKGAYADPEYMKNCESTYNSPKNIRRLFITGDKVYIQYYTSMMYHGKQERGTWETRALKNDEGKSLFDMAKAIIDYNENRNKISMESEVGLDTESINYEFTEGNLLKAMYNGWVLSNIEELYVDWTALLCKDTVRALFNSDSSSYEVITKFSQKVPASDDNIKSANQLKGLITSLNMGRQADMAERFPRLRIVAIVQHLKDIMENTSMNKANLSVSDGYDNVKKTWFNINEQLIKGLGGYTFVTSFNGSIEKYVTAQYQYLFDAKLEVWMKSYIESIKKARREVMYASEETEETEDNTNQSSIEQRLIEIEQSLDSKRFGQLLKIAKKHVGKSELKEIFSDFSKENRSRYAELANVKLN